MRALLAVALAEQASRPGDAIDAMVAARSSPLADHPVLAASFALALQASGPAMRKQAEAGIDLWIREIAPSDQLRIWFDHRPNRWAEFSRRYRDELNDNPVLGRLQAFCRGRKVTLVFAARDRARNNAVVLADLMTAPSAASRPDS